MKRFEDENTFALEPAMEQLMQDKELDTLVILGHVNPDGDAVGSVMGAAHYLAERHPEWKIYPYLSDDLGNGPGALLAEEQRFDWNLKPPVDPMNDRYAVLVCDTATRDRIYGREYWEGAQGGIVIDHHRGNENYGSLGIVDCLESCAELVYHCLEQDTLRQVALSQREGYGASYVTVADYLYLGILHDTQSFTRANSTRLHATADLLSMGVDHRRLMATRHTKTLAQEARQGMYMSQCQRWHRGDIASYYCNLVMQEREGIVYEDIHDLCNVIRDCSDVIISLTMFEMAPNEWKISVRSDGTVDMNKFAHAFGGGGHQGAAGLSVKTDEPENFYHKMIDELKRLLDARTAESKPMSKSE